MDDLKYKDEWIQKLSEDASFIVQAKDEGVLDVLDSTDWVELIIRQPILGGYFKNWKIFTPNDWAMLLSEMPFFFEKCDKWEEFEILDWVMLLSERPNLGIHCRTWESFSAEDWVNLLLAQPCFAERCDKWNEFTLEDWELLSPELYDKCPEEILKQMEPHTVKKAPVLPEIILRPTFELTSMLYPELDEYDVLFKQGYLAEHFHVSGKINIPNGLEKFVPLAWGSAH